MSSGDESYMPFAQGDPSSVKLDRGVHFRRPVDVNASLGGNGAGDGDSEGEPSGEGEEAAEDKDDKDTKEEGNGGRRLFRMPILDSEVSDQPVLVGRKVLEDSDSESEAGGEPQDGAEGEAGAEGEGGAVTKVTKTYFAEGTDCENLLVDNPAAHLMINQDIIIAYARGDAIRVQDTFTPSRARPSPDVFFGGEDDILDAVSSDLSTDLWNISAHFHQEMLSTKAE